MSISYKDSGVDWKRGDEFVARIKELVSSTYNDAVKSPIGGYASLYDIGGGRLLAAGTDGVGTKLKVAQILNKHDTVGIDLVAMCVNDIICVGARPLFFLDYLASGKLEIETNAAVVKGIVEACRETSMALVGGETAEMPGMYQDGDYDLAGFCVGEVNESDVIDGSSIVAGDDIVCLPSSGIHSNGFSMVRKLIQAEETQLLEKALVPTRLYVAPILAAMKKFKLKGLAHITGSGFNNVRRINSNIAYEFSNLPESQEIFSLLQERSNSSDREMFSTFNMGTGMVIVCENGQELTEFFKDHGQAALLCGKVAAGNGEIRIKTPKLDIEL